MFIGATEPLKSLAISRKQYLIITATYKTSYDNSVMPYRGKWSLLTTVERRLPCYYVFERIMHYFNEKYCKKCLNIPSIK